MEAMLRTTVRLASLLALIATGTACGGDDDPFIPGTVFDAAPQPDGDGPAVLPATTTCGTGLHAEMCDSAAEICGTLAGGGFGCEPLPDGCGGTTDAERTCETCAAACGGDACTDDATVNSVTCG